MKAHKVELLIVDTDDVGAEEISVILANQKYPNWCIAPDVVGITTVDIGEWHDDHPLNKLDQMEAEYHRLFDTTIPPPLHRTPVECNMTYKARSSKRLRRKQRARIYASLPWWWRFLFWTHWRVWGKGEAKYQAVHCWEVLSKPQ